MVVWVSVDIANVEGNCTGPTQHTHAHTADKESILRKIVQQKIFYFLERKRDVFLSKVSKEEDPKQGSHHQRRRKVRG
jgi:hypothetical protein